MLYLFSYIITYSLVFSTINFLTVFLFVALILNENTSVLFLNKFLVKYYKYQYLILCL